MSEILGVYDVRFGVVHLELIAPAFQLCHQFSRLEFCEAHLFRFLQFSGEVVVMFFLLPRLTFFLLAQSQHTKLYSPLVLVNFSMGFTHPHLLHTLVSIYYYLKGQFLQ